MGSKNRVLLGILSDIIMHHFKNIIKDKSLYITKFKIKKIRNKHPEIVHFILANDFQTIIDNTIAVCHYEIDGIHNLLSLVDGRYILYSVSVNNFYTESGTLFFTSKRQLRKCQDSIKFFNASTKMKFESYIKEN